jgi:hypothetical protein
MPRPKPNCDNLLNEYIFSKGFTLSKELDKNNFNTNTLIYIQCKKDSKHTFVTNVSEMKRKNIILEDFCPHCKKEKKCDQMGIPKEKIENYAKQNNLSYLPVQPYYNRWEDQITFTCLSCGKIDVVKSLGYFEKNRIDKKIECEGCELKLKGIKTDEEVEDY